MTFGYVCTNYKNSAYTQEAVRSLLKDGGDEFRVVVVDNNSDSKNVEVLKNLASEFRHVELILNTENVGYFRGLNMGIRHLRSSQPEINFMIVGNNDLVFPADFAETLKKNLSTLEKYAVVAPDIITLDGIHQNPHVIHKISKFREFIYDLYYANYYLGIAILKLAKASRRFTERGDQTQHQIAQEIYMGLGACYMLGPKFFRYFEELWAPTFLVHEEYFLSKQLNDKGLCIYYEPAIKVLHHFRAAMAALGDREAWRISRDAHKMRRQYVKVFG